mmetsp:Transcript_41225/g.53186  ORF Transcript_41225/g.53186 Transcript_41225/m.53186 type:complete len:289 (+) Transcript_41225:58-924(+)
MASASECQIVRLPTIFIPHGGGPLPILKPDELSKSMASILQPGELMSAETINSIKTILFVSAHWEESQPTLTTSPDSNLLFDYHGFPPETYEYKWPAPKPSKEVTERIAELLNSSGFETAYDSKRGFDHGVFIPGILMEPNPTIPVIQLSLLSNLNPNSHLNLGKALEPLRKEGVLIIASGLSYHNMGGFFGRISNSLEHSIKFDQYLHEACCHVNHEKRIQMLNDWLNAPYSRECHPREEHLIPLHVAVGAASDSIGRRYFDNSQNGGMTDRCVFGGWIFESSIENP